MRTKIKLHVSQEQQDYIAQNFNGNLLKIESYLNQLSVTGGVCSDLNKFSFFHILGKFLYNKRLDDQGQIIKPKKAQMLQKKDYKLYFSHSDILQNMVQSHEVFNDFLAENYYKHYTEIKELAKTAETFSYTEKLSNFNYKRQDNDNSSQYLRSLINSMAVTCENLSQYENSGMRSSATKKMIKYQKPLERSVDLYAQKKQNKEMFMDLVKQRPYLSRCTNDIVKLEINPIFDRIKKGKSPTFKIKVTESDEEEVHEGELTTENIYVEEDSLEPAKELYSHKTLVSIPHQIYEEITIDNFEDNIEAIMETIDDEEQHDDAPIDENE